MTPTSPACVDLSCAFLDPNLKPGSKSRGVELKGYEKAAPNSRYETLTPTYNAKGAGG